LGFVLSSIATDSRRGKRSENCPSDVSQSLPGITRDSSLILYEIGVYTCPFEPVFNDLNSNTLPAVEMRARLYKRGIYGRHRPIVNL
jgi:hypothetical protein